ncbi:helix-turn-helix transcriptional regulator [Frankia sp. AiPa1]|uniref:helix-turn-helix domain-containing protein n=1 Tax=Frankia sp. AiPa1 TaxID=573492 RepID=UPI00202B715D|nr:helix-turn-helix transcriptional regulator [Frankia sp. AiPa1]MCL9759061.1 helix-turn-helix domain-containing protein [Frankia sp. AiPa1]
MVRTALTPAERARGERLGVLLREARGARGLAEVAAGAGVSAETLRKIETGRIPTPAFFTITALGATLGISLDVLAALCAAEDDSAAAARVATAAPGAA